MSDTPPFTKKYPPHLSLPELQEWLRYREKESNCEMTTLSAASDAPVNIADYVKASNPGLPLLTLVPRDQMAGITGKVFYYSDVYVGGDTEAHIQEVLSIREAAEIAPSNKEIKWTGKIATFGGPEDMGVKPHEGLALISANNFEQFREYFLAEQPPGTTGLARRLNNKETRYIACRWDYKVTPAAFLRRTKVIVQANGKSFEAQPVDWGPGIQERIADLSDKLAKDLGVETDVHDVTIIIPATHQSNDFPAPDNPAKVATTSPTAPPSSFSALIAKLNLTYFTASEILATTHRTSGGVANSEPPKALWKNIIPTLIVLEKVRERFGPIRLTSTYRSEAYNRAVGGVDASQHLDFRAIDFYCDGGSTVAIANYIKGLRGYKFTIPIKFEASDMKAASAGLNTEALNFTPLPGDLTEFTFHGGTKGYADKNFIHIDCRGEDSNWG